MAAAVRAAARSSGLARYTALHVASLEGKQGHTQLLLRLGAAINARSKSGATPLFAACEAGHAAVVRVLLRAGADMWIPTATHENCLYIAALKGNSDVWSPQTPASRLLAPLAAAADCAGSRFDFDRACLLDLFAARLPTTPCSFGSIDGPHRQLRVMLTQACFIQWRGVPADT